MPGRGFFEPCACFLWNSPHVSFLYADLVLYSLIVINHSYEYNYTLSPLSSSESLKLGVALGTPDTSPCILNSNVTFSVEPLPTSPPQKNHSLDCFGNPIHTTCAALHDTLQLLCISPSPLSTGGCFIHLHITMSWHRDYKLNIRSVHTSSIEL